MKGFSLSAWNYEQTVCKILKGHPDSFKHEGQITRHKDNNTVCKNSLWLRRKFDQIKKKILITVTIMKSVATWCEQLPAILDSYCR